MSASPVMIPSGSDDKIPARLTPLSHAALAEIGLDAKDCTFTAVDSELSSLVSAYVVKHATAQSFTLNVGSASDDDRKKGGSRRRCIPSLGLGCHEFMWEGHTFYALHEELGEPVGSDCGATFYRHLVLLAPGRTSLPALKAFGDALLEAADKTEARSFTIYRWDVRHSYWMREQIVRARPLQSVVLPAATEKRVVDDLDDFLSETTRDWYADHGIPHKRGYLLYGVPGGGKTSLLQALAGKYGRNLCYLSPTHPDMTDDSLKNAVTRAPANSMLVIEDVDALFGKDREKKIEKSPLTFSGLLNALDGVGKGGGSLFFLTSNHRENLDPALIREGRVDVHVCFEHANAEQMAGLFAQFYPRAENKAELGADFAAKLQERLGNRKVTMAGLQSFFIKMRHEPAEEAARQVELVTQEMDSREGKAEGKADGDGDGDAEGGAGGKEKAGKKEKAETAEADEEADGEDEEEEGAGSSAVHIHLHGLGRNGGKAKKAKAKPKAVPKKKPVRAAAEEEEEE